MAKPNFSRRPKTCPFSGKDGLKIDYKDINLLSDYISESGKIIPSRIMFVSNKKQRELSQAIKRARQIGLLPFSVVRTERTRTTRPPRSNDRYSKSDSRTEGRS